jgi:hypothetical protein
MEQDKADVGIVQEGNIAGLSLPDGTDPLAQQVVDGGDVTKKRKKSEVDPNTPRDPPSYSFRANRYLPLVALYKKNTTIWDEKEREDREKEREREKKDENNPDEVNDKLLEPDEVLAALEPILAPSLPRLSQEGDDGTPVKTEAEEGKKKRKSSSAKKRPRGMSIRPEGRREHHIKWTDEEAKKLLEGVALYGYGQWAQICAWGFDVYRRTNVDLKDKMRILTSRPDELKRLVTEVYNEGHLHGNKDVNTFISEMLQIRSARKKVRLSAPAALGSGFTFIPPSVGGSQVPGNGSAADSNSQAPGMMRSVDPMQIVQQIAAAQIAAAQRERQQQEQQQQDQQDALQQQQDQQAQAQLQQQDQQAMAQPNQ